MPGLTQGIIVDGIPRNLPVVVSSGRSVVQTAAVSSICSYTVGPQDGSFMLSANVLVTTATTHDFFIEAVWTDEGGTSRTQDLLFLLISSTGASATHIINTSGAVPYMGILQPIRAKSGTTITIRTQAAGTYTTVVYNAEAQIIQVA